MYVEFLGYLEDSSLNLQVEKAIGEFAPDFDTSCCMDIDEDEDGRVYARFWYGADEFYNDESELIDEDSPEYDEAVSSNESYCLEIYIGLLKLQEGGLIKDCWLQNGWQFGKRPSIEAANEWLDSITAKNAE